jgi:histidyl-tRNA synthetase
MPDRPLAPQRPRGTQDILPREQPLWRRMTDAADTIASLYGYRPVETPILEETSLFTRTAGESSDIVTKEMYTFTDRGNRSLTLRPEGTAPVVRAYFDGHLDQEPQPVRLYYQGPFFRYDRPQAGRYRELHQFGIEAIGDAHPTIDQEVVEVGWRWFERLGIRGVSLQLNSIGDAVCRPRYRDALREYFRPYLERLTPEDRGRFERNPLRLLDSKDPDSVELLADAPKTLDYLCEACAAAFAEVEAGLRQAGIAFTINPRLVRGLDYYTRTTFEYWHESLKGAQNSLGGGGRYDGLAEDLGYRSTPGIGFAIGLERSAMILAGLESPAPAGPAVYAVGVDGADLAVLHRLVSDLRREGIEVVSDAVPGKLDARLRKADRRNARLALIVGPDELARGQVVLRDLRQKTQSAVSLDQLARAVERGLRG